MNILFLDLSLSNTGVVIFDDTGRWINSLSIDTNGKDSYSLRLKRIEKKFKELKSNYKPSLVVVEESFTRFNRSTQAIYRCRAVMELVFWNVKQVFYPATKVRKSILGAGNAKKEQVQEHINAKYNFLQFDDGDQIDAMALAECYFKEKGVRIHV